MAAERALEGKRRGGAVARWHIKAGTQHGDLTWCGRRLRGLTIWGQPAEAALAAGEGSLCPDCEAAQAADRPRSWKRR